MAKSQVKIGALIEHDCTGEIGTIIEISTTEANTVMIRWNSSPDPARR